MKKTVTKAKKQKAKKGMNPKHELFCIHMTKPGAPTFNNATLSYAVVYNPNMFKMSRYFEKNDDGDVTGASEYDLAYANCNANGSRLLAKDSIRKRIQQRMLKLFGDDDAVDERLAHLAFQDTDLHVSLAAVRDRNKLKKRLTDEPATPPGAAPITKIEIVMPK